MDRIDRSLARAMLARTLKQGLRYPTGRALQAFGCEMGRRALRQSAAALAAGTPSGGELCEAVEALCRAADLSPSGLERAYTSLLGGSPRGRVRPHETDYGGGGPFDRSRELAEISGFYRAFGLEAAQTGGERLDHAACEFEFIEFLSLKEAEAIETHDAGILEITRTAIRDFLRDHLARFGVAFGVALKSEEGDRFYGSLGVLCVALLRVECERLGVTAGPELLELRPVDDQPPAARTEEEPGPIEIIAGPRAGCGGHR